LLAGQALLVGGAGEALVGVEEAVGSARAAVLVEEAAGALDRESAADPVAEVADLAFFAEIVTVAAGIGDALVGFVIAELARRALAAAHAVFGGRSVEAPAEELGAELSERTGSRAVALVGEAVPEVALVGGQVARLARIFGDALFFADALGADHAVAFHRAALAGAAIQVLGAGRRRRRGIFTRTTRPDAEAEDHRESERA
jgi:hypothetical protein